MSNSTASPSGGPPWRVAVERTSWMYSATARTSSSDSGTGGIPDPSAAVLPFWMTGPISSPCRSRSTSCERKQVGPAQVAAPQVDAVAGAAVDAVDPPSAGDQLGIPGRALQRRVEALAPRLSPCLCGPAGRLRFGSAGRRSSGAAAGCRALSAPRRRKPPSPGAGPRFSSPSDSLSASRRLWPGRGGCQARPSTVLRH